MSLIFIFLLLQHLSVSVVSSPWFTPDFAVLGLVLALRRSPEHWILYAMIVSVALLLPASRFFFLLASSTLLLGGLIAWVSARWDLTNRRVLLAVAGFAVLAMNGMLIWAEDLWSWTVFLYLVCRTGLSLLCCYCLFPFLRRPTVSSLHV